MDSGRIAHGPIKVRRSVSSKQFAKKPQACPSPVAPIWPLIYRFSRPGCEFVFQGLQPEDLEKGFNSYSLCPARTKAVTAAWKKLQACTSFGGFDRWALVDLCRTTRGPCYTTVPTTIQVRVFGTTKNIGYLDLLGYEI